MNDVRVCDASRAMEHRTPAVHFKAWLAERQSATESTSSTSSPVMQKNIVDEKRSRTT
jgi:hypothetical protein